jgi:hypothetical protein
MPRTAAVTAALISRAKALSLVRFAAMKDEPTTEMRSTAVPKNSLTNFDLIM